MWNVHLGTISAYLVKQRAPRSGSFGGSPHGMVMSWKKCVGWAHFLGGVVAIQPVGAAADDVEDLVSLPVGVAVQDFGPHLYKEGFR